MAAFGGSGGAPIWAYVCSAPHSGGRKRGFTKANSVRKEASKKRPSAVSRAGSSLCYYVSAKARKRSRRGVFTRWRHFRSKKKKVCHGGRRKEVAHRAARCRLVALCALLPFVPALQGKHLHDDDMKTKNARATCDAFTCFLTKDVISAFVLLRGARRGVSAPS